MGKAPACGATHTHFSLDLLCRVLRVFQLSSVASLAGNDNELPSSSRTIKEKRDAYVRRLNEIYENNVTKVWMLLFPEPAVEAGLSVYFLCSSALMQYLGSLLLLHRLALTSSVATASSPPTRSPPSRSMGRSTRLLTSSLRLVGAQRCLLTVKFPVRTRIEQAGGKSRGGRKLPAVIHAKINLLLCRCQPRYNQRWIL